MELKDDDIMPFGRHFKKKLKDVPADYLFWLLDQQWARIEYPDIIAYIRKNKKALEMELDNQEDDD